jgi:hypothetical protein
MVAALNGILIAVGGAVMITGEIVNELPTGILATFTVDNAYADNSEMVFVNGQAMTRGASYNYVPTGSLKKIVFNAGSIPKAGDVIMVNYARVIV